MSQFELYFQLGFQHISDLSAYDHILFIVALCVPCLISEWKNILVLVTAFTIGHSATLAASTLGYVLIPGDIIEFLIPVTIFITAIISVFNISENEFLKKINFNYLLTLFFGFIHGLGFSNYLRMLLGREESMITPLFAFNVGLEIGQIMIVGIVLGVSFAIMAVFKIVHRNWVMAVSSIVAGYSILMIYEARFW